MKEFEYKDEVGFESLNTDRQLDTFEIQKFKAQKDRYIYDFSQPISLSSNPYTKGQYDNYAPDYYLPVYNPSAPLYKTQYYYPNLTAYNNTFEGYGIPGNAEVVFKDYMGTKIWTGGDSSTPPPTLSFIPGITPAFEEQFNTGVPSTLKNQVPYWNKNCAIYIDSKFSGAYGAGNNPTAIKSFRSGYIELTIKTSNQNCIVAWGSGTNSSISSAWNGEGPDAQNANTSAIISNGSPTFIDSDIAVSNDEYSNINELQVRVKNGKLSVFYQDLFGNDKNEFEILSNKTVADDAWHHVVINFGKPGSIRNQSKKTNKRFIEVWIDGKSDVLNYDYINNKQVFFPLPEWLFVNPRLTFGKPSDTGWRSSDTGRAQLGLTEFNSILTSEFNPAGDSVAFSGSLNHYIVGLNQCLSKSEIEIRYALCKGYENSFVLPFNASAKIVEPTITTNKKKALKLFWNELPNNKHGIELDSNYQVDAYSVTHKNITSKTETHNIDLSNDKPLQFLPDVKSIFTDHINIFGPGKRWVQDNGIFAASGIRDQSNMKAYSSLDSFDTPLATYTDPNPKQDYSQHWLTDSAVIDYPFSGLNLQNGDRILLTNQFRAKENGIYVFNGVNKLLTRAIDASSPTQLLNAVVRVTDGYFKDTSWMLTNQISSIGDSQYWTQLQYHPKQSDVNSQPIFTSRWIGNGSTERFININEDLDITKYDLIVFMNYPENNEEIKQNFIGYDDFEIKSKYDDFIKSIQNACAQGASLYVSSPKLAQDLGIIKTYKLIDQMLETSDAQSATISPFEINESADQYFDTHRINQYQLQTEVAGLTNKETYILTDFINYVPSNINENEEYHAKYAYRQLGLKEGNQFFIPSLSLLKIAENEKLPGFNANRKGTKELAVVEPNQINAGTIVTKLQNTYYQNGQVVNNPYDDDATTIIVHNGQTLNGQPITGKIFVNFVEDGYTMSRQEYNKAFIQVLPGVDTNETTATRAWQYSTTRLNRVPRKINIRSLTEYGQTTPTNGGGGPLIQAPSNASNGIIRSRTDSGNIDYQSDLYSSEAEEIYPIQEIPVLSMTWLGLQWLAE